jgi:cystathionine gamma-lyase
MLDTPFLGLAACSSLIHLLESGDHMIAMDDLYGGSNRLFRKVVHPKMNIETSFVDMTDHAKVDF